MLQPDLEVFVSPEAQSGGLALPAGDWDIPDRFTSLGRAPGADPQQGQARLSGSVLSFYLPQTLLGLMASVGPAFLPLQTPPCPPLSSDSVLWSPASAGDDEEHAGVRLGFWLLFEPPASQLFRKLVKNVIPGPTKTHQNHL